MYVNNVVLFLLGDSPVSKFLWRRFETLCSYVIGGVSRENNQDEIQYMAKV